MIGSTVSMSSTSLAPELECVVLVATVESSVSDELAVVGWEKWDCGSSTVWAEVLLKPEKIRFTGSKEKESLLIEGMEMLDGEDL